MVFHWVFEWSFWKGLKRWFSCGLFGSELGTPDEVDFCSHLSNYWLRCYSLSGDMPSFFWSERLIGMFWGFFLYFFGFFYVGFIVVISYNFYLSACGLSGWVMHLKATNVDLPGSCVTLCCWHVSGLPHPVCFSHRALIRPLPSQQMFEHVQRRHRVFFVYIGGESTLKVPQGFTSQSLNTSGGCLCSQRLQTCFLQMKTMGF